MRRWIVKGMTEMSVERLLICCLPLMTFDLVEVMGNIFWHHLSTISWYSWKLSTGSHSHRRFWCWKRMIRLWRQSIGDLRTTINLTEGEKRRAILWYRKDFLTCNLPPSCRKIGAPLGFKSIFHISAASFWKTLPTVRCDDILPSILFAFYRENGLRYEKAKLTSKSLNIKSKQNGER